MDSKESDQPIVFLRARQCGQKFGVVTNTWWRWVKAGIAPQPDVRRSGYTAWSAKAVNDMAARWLAEGRQS